VVKRVLESNDVVPGGELAGLRPHSAFVLLIPGGAYKVQNGSKNDKPALNELDLPCSVVKRVLESNDVVSGLPMFQTSYIHNTNLFFIPRFSMSQPTS